MKYDRHNILGIKFRANSHDYIITDVSDTKGYYKPFPIPVKFEELFDPIADVLRWLNCGSWRVLEKPEVNNTYQII